MALIATHSHHTVEFKLKTSYLRAYFTCEDHPKCDLVKTIEAFVEDEDKYSITPTILEWFDGENETALRDGDVILEPEDSFVKWKYVEETHLDEIQALFEKDHASEYYMLGSLNPETHDFHISAHCTHEHTPEDYYSPSCWAWVLNEYEGELFEMFAGEDGVNWANDYIKVWSETDTSYWEEPETTILWDYV